MASRSGVRLNETESAPPGEPATVIFEGKPLAAKEGEPLTAALLAHGIDIASRSVKYHRPRGAFCLAGICGQCWLRIDDVPNRAACTTAVRNGMTATRENAFPSADHDILRAADYAFPGGLDHHTLGTTPLRSVNVIIGSTARQLAGLGSLSRKEPPPPSAIHVTACDVLVIGGGPAGLAAARAAARAGAGVLLLEKRKDAGGHLNTGLFDDEPELRDLPPRWLDEFRRSGGVTWTRAIAAGIYRGTGGSKEVLVRRAFGGGDEHLAIVRPDLLVLATGGYEQAALFGGNDLPGHYAARGFAKLALRRGIIPGKKAVILDGAPEGETGVRLEKRLSSIGLECVRLATGSKTVVNAKGTNRIKSVEIVSTIDPRSDRESLRCDLVISAFLPSPAFELAHQAGCELEHRPESGGFPVVIDPATCETNVSGVYAAGDLTGAPTARRAIEQGEIAGAHAAAKIGSRR
jgi:sarcosine oxidase, subunit alpha